jgi:hypothetical protein
MSRAGAIDVEGSRGRRWEREDGRERELVRSGRRMGGADVAAGILNYFDWASPMIAGAQDVIKGPHQTFVIPVDCGASLDKIEKKLRSRGIATWGAMYDWNWMMITVPLAKREKAMRILDGMGVEYVTRQ